MTQLSGLPLAYIGDAYYELQIRMYLINKGFTLVNDLHKQAILYTSAVGQDIAIKYLMRDILTEAEMTLFKRGRNATSTHKPKNADLTSYRFSTGFETLIGYLYIENQIDRANFLIQKSIEAIEELQK